MNTFPSEDSRIHTDSTRPNILESLITFDLSEFLAGKDSKVAYDYLKLAAALQGLANRDSPQCYFFYESNPMAMEADMDMDRYWFKKLRVNGQFLFSSFVVNENDFGSLLLRFGQYYKGIVLWDEDVPATSNVASTIAGADDLLPVRYDPVEGSVYSELMSRNIPVRSNLVGKFTGQGMIPDTSIPSSGSAKNDAYLWAKVRYLDTGKTNPGLMEYALDASPWHNRGTEIDSSLCSLSIPRTLKAGSSHKVSLTFANTGTRAWHPEDHIRLEATRAGAGVVNRFVWTSSDEEYPGYIKPLPFRDNHIVAPGERITFQFTITAPELPGRHTFCARMRMGNLWIGDFYYGQIKVVNVATETNETAEQQIGTFYYPDLPGTYLTNSDYYISRKAFFFDLSPDPHTAPNDDPGQIAGSDLRTLTLLLESQYKQANGSVITIGGFVPWMQKYTKSVSAHFTLNPVAAEWTFIDLASKYNAQLDPDAGGLCVLANASVFMHVPAHTRYKQKNGKNSSIAQLPNPQKKYITFYMADFDSGAWCSSVLPLLWDDPGRGSLPLAWSFAPDLSARIPHVFNYLYDTMSSNDYFVSADNGTGYLNPMMLESGNRPHEGASLLQAWENHNKLAYRRFDLDITGFLISGLSESLSLSVQEAYSRISPVGVGTNGGYPHPMVNGVPFTSVVTAGMEEEIPAVFAERIAGILKVGGAFHMFRIILTRPGILLDAVKYIQEKYPELNMEVVDPYTYFHFYRQSMLNQT